MSDEILPDRNVAAPLMDIREFVAGGYLQEVNRCFLHRVGLALQIRVADDGTMALDGIVDARNDPEGIIFADTPNREKALKVWDERAAKDEERQRRFGYRIQPFGGE